MSKTLIISAFSLATGVLPVRAQLGFADYDLGDPRAAGYSRLVGTNGYDVAGAGAGFQGGQDQFHFSFAEAAGDFDVKVRLQSFDAADAWAKAGLMVRETLATNSRFAAVLASPNIAGCLFQFRTNATAVTLGGSSYPATYPNLWLRLQRASNTFSSFAGLEGQRWSPLGSVTLTPPPTNTMLVGLAVSSRAAQTRATAEFRDLARVDASETTPPAALPREPLGLSSRRTGLVISEIMYHPRDVAGFSNRLEFVELHNAYAVHENLSGYRLSGSIDYTFPPNTLLKAGEFLVVARDPVALRSHYGVSNSLGPWLGAETNGLPGNSGLVQLRTKSGAVLLEVPYRGGNPWPIAADGAGHSLVLARPSYGEGSPKAWAASARIDGSPGRDDPWVTDPLDAVRINEFFAHSKAPFEDYIELYNHSRTPVDLSGAWLSDDAQTNKYRFLPGSLIEPGGYLVLDEALLGFGLRASGERLYLRNPSLARVIDAIEYKGQAADLSGGRFPDGADSFYVRQNPTPGYGNEPPLLSPVVINEIMYAPITGDNDDEYLELYNTQSTPIDLARWRLADGVSFVFPDKTIIPPHGYLVVARNLTHLMGRYAGMLSRANTVGNYTGSLANNGERIALAMPEVSITTNALTRVVTTNSFYVEVNEVTYGDGGRWGHWADGGGSSLELMDPQNDNRLPSNWADSDETSKSRWSNVEFTGPTGETLGAPVGDSLHLYLLGVGECLIDDVEVRVNNGANILTNGGFESGLLGWFPQGSQDQSTIEDSGFTGTRSLHLRSASRGDPGANRVRSARLSPIATGLVTLRAKTRWLRGWPELLLRLHGGGFEAFGKLSVPTDLGTPGARNSRAVTNAGPAIYEVSHTPILPQANQPVTITARIRDSDYLSSVRVNYRVEGPSPVAVTAVSLRDDGEAGDAVANDGVFTATLPGQPGGSVLAFYIQAVDMRRGTNRFPVDVFPLSGLTRSFPNDSPSRECLIRFGDRVMGGSFGTYHLWMTTGTSNRWHVRDSLNNAGVDVTYVYNGVRAVYNAEALYSGSAFHINLMRAGPAGASRCDYVVRMPEDDRVLGASDFNLALPGNSNGTDTTDASAQAEQTSYILFRELGLPAHFRRYVHVFVNGSRRSQVSNLTGAFVLEDAQQPNRDVVDEWFPENPNGDLIKIEDWYEFNDAATSFESNNNDADLQRRVTGFNGQTNLNLAPYRFMWRKRALGAGDSANDYSSILRLINLVSPTTDPNVSVRMDAVRSIVDLEQWMRNFACQRAVGNFDSYGYNRGKNSYLYQPVGDRFVVIPWDIDWTLGTGLGRGPTDPLFGSSDPRVVVMYNTPEIRRMSLRAFKELVEGPFSNAFLDSIMDQKAEALGQNGINYTRAALDGIKTYINRRRDFILSQLGQMTNGFGVARSVQLLPDGNLVRVEGFAQVGVQTIRVNGVVYPVTWGTNWTNWSVTLSLATGENQFVVEGYDRFGQLIPGASATTVINHTQPGLDPVGQVGFNEVLFSPAVPGSAFVEIYNRSGAAFDLSGWKIQGLDYAFAAGTVITNGQHLILAQDRVGYQSAFGPLTPLFDTFSGDLNPHSQALILTRPTPFSQGEVVVDQIRYEDQRPWPTSTQTNGISLQLLDASVDHSRPSAWTAGGVWGFASRTGNVLNASNLMLWLGSAGSCYLDDLALVGPDGRNVITDGDFEAPLDDSWIVPTNYAATHLTATVSHSGRQCLFVSGTSPGGQTMNSILHNVGLSIVPDTVYTLSYWFLMYTNPVSISVRTQPGLNLATTAAVRSLVASPGESNYLSQILPPYEPLWLNELQANNLTTILDNGGEPEPWIELFNSGTNTIQLDNYYLTDDYETNLLRWRFPRGSQLAPGEFKVIWADGQSEETDLTDWHTAFRLSADGGTVALVRVVEDQPQVTDYLTYPAGLPDGSYGDFPDGQLIHRVNCRNPTPGAPNVAMPPALWINEWMAANTSTIQDEADGQFDDWFEIYNAGDAPVDLGGYYLTDRLDEPTRFQVPANGHYRVLAGGFLLVWADGEERENSTDRVDLHASFQLSRNGEAIGLFAPDGRTRINAVSFGVQTNNVSQGRFADGGDELHYMTAPTPRARNVVAGANSPPLLEVTADCAVTLGQTLAFTIEAFDPDVPPQTLAFTLDSGAPQGATIDRESGYFAWTPSSGQAPSTNTIIVRVTDDGSPPLSDTRTLTIRVRPPPQLRLARNRNGKIVLGFETQVGRAYRIEYKNDLNHLYWERLAGEIIATDNGFVMEDDLEGHPQRFYRVVQAN